LDYVPRDDRDRYEKRPNGEFHLRVDDANAPAQPARRPAPPTTAELVNRINKARDDRRINRINDAAATSAVRA
jgi:hypothetical protein